MCRDFDSKGGWEGQDHPIPPEYDLEGLQKFAECYVLSNILLAIPYMYFALTTDICFACISI